MAEESSETKPEAPGIGMRLTIAGIRQKFPSVKNISTELLESWMKSGKETSLTSGEKTSATVQSEGNSKNDSPAQLLLLDSRPEEEYQVGHIPGAHRVDYEADVDAILNAVTDLQKPDDKTVVCYCSVGYRSSMVAQKLNKYHKEQGGSINVFNLEGSIFKWANEGRPMVDGNNKSTRCTHPYNAVFGKLLNKDLRKTSKI